MSININNDKVQVTLKGVAYTYRLDMGALLVFEQFLKKVPEELKTPQRVDTVFFYACLYGSEGFTMSYDEFVDCIDSLDVLEALREATTVEEKRWGACNLASAIVDCDDNEGDEPKKK